MLGKITGSFSASKFPDFIAEVYKSVKQQHYLKTEVTTIPKYLTDEAKHDLIWWREYYRCL